MDEPSTCGRGLASRSSLPAKLGELFAAQATILEVHARALDPDDLQARHELDAYAALVVAHRDVADRLTAIARQMAGYRDLPMAPHDEAAMSDALALNAFESFTRTERELATLLQQLSQGDEDMLQQMSD
ncbi:hypothetical protein H7J93_04620 [Mycobacterium barrassiae]|uniref:hypothetical protein n=1 Tax=Mycobacterium barrassiae TaxID=319709 RepID=UPI00226593E4|nr:hypothetical protein [Mycobacterium barrassiae]MCV7298918.1 hypothetical protein [Mycobacterium barrassiae]